MIFRIFINVQNVIKKQKEAKNNGNEHLKNYHFLTVTHLNQAKTYMYIHLKIEVTIITVYHMMSLFSSG